MSSVGCTVTRSCAGSKPHSQRGFAGGQVPPTRTAIPFDRQLLPTSGQLAVRVCGDESQRGVGLPGFTSQCW